MRLFVDCDDTLVLWFNGDEQTEGVLLPGPNPYGAGADRWKPNVALMDALDAWRRANPEGELILWTGGGLDYAQLWQRRVYRQADDAISKDTRIPFSSDLCIDDMPIKVACPVVTWQEFVDSARTEATPASTP